MLNKTLMSIILVLAFLSCDKSEPNKRSEKNNIKEDQTINLITERNPYNKYSTEEAVVLFLKKVKGEEPLSETLNKKIILISQQVQNSPEIDGKEEGLWKNIKGIYAYDSVAKKNVLIKSIYNKTNQEIYFLVSFNDSSKSEYHKLWKWDIKEKIYIQSNIREDVFVFKWNLNQGDVDLSVYSDQDYKADVWFWKANRTNPIGFADDKIQWFSTIKKKEYHEITTLSNQKRYILRRGDKGKSAYESTFPTEFVEEHMPRFINRIPNGSRGDIQAKGVWDNSKWVIEFKRKLLTGYSDDIQFNDLSKEYLFGISCKEIAGRYPNERLDQPMYGSGNINNQIFLKFK